MLFTTVLVLPFFAFESAGRFRFRRDPGRSAAGGRGRRGDADDASAAPRAPSSPSGHPLSESGAPRLRTAVLLSFASGAFLAMHFALWITSLSYTSVASSTVLVTTHPVIVAFVGFLLLGERLSLRGLAFMVAALAGSVVLVSGGLGTDGSAAFGNLLAFLGAVTVSGYMLLGRVVRRTLSVNTYTIIVYAVAAALLFIASIAGGTRLGPYPLHELALFFALALFCTLLGHSLFNWALKYLKPTVISTSILGEPVIASLLAVFLFGEVPTPYTLAGGAIILVSIYLFVRHEASSRRRGGATPADGSRTSA
jgi:drug/metabolite transporter (DMT)-like permease